MSVRERVLASWLSEKIAENREYAEKIGISAVVRKKGHDKEMNLQTNSQNKKHM